MTFIFTHEGRPNNMNYQVPPHSWRIMSWRTHAISRRRCWGLILLLLEPVDHLPFRGFCDIRRVCGGETQFCRSCDLIEIPEFPHVIIFDLQMHIIFLKITDIGKQAFSRKQHSCRMSLNTLSSTSCLHRVIQGKWAFRELLEGKREAAKFMKN